MNTAKILRITEHRGNPRLWLQGKAPERSGFMPGARYSVVPTANGVIIKVADDGDRTVSRKVYRSGGVAPVLDVNSGMDLGPLMGCEVARVRHQNADFAFLVKPLPCESTTYAHFCGSFVVATA